MKQILALDGYKGTDSWGEHFDLEDMISWILGALVGAAGNRRKVRDMPVVIGVPVEYENESTGSRDLALRRMLAAAGDVGFANVSFLEEPKAALVYEAALGTRTGGDEVCLAVDFGGGTFDAAVSASGVTPWATDAVRGVAVGGEHFDSRIFTECVAPELGITPVLDRFARLRNRASAVRGTGETEFRLALRKAAQDRVRGAAMLSQIFERGQVYDLWRAIERAKIDLSEGTRATVDFRRPGVEVVADVTRDQFEQAIADEMSQVGETMLAACASAGVSPESVTLVVKTGGSSSLPVFSRLLGELFPNAQVQARPALTTIAEGLGHYVRALDGALGVARKAPETSSESSKTICEDSGTPVPAGSAMATPAPLAGEADVIDTAESIFDLAQRAWDFPSPSQSGPEESEERAGMAPSGSFDESAGAPFAVTRDEDVPSAPVPAPADTTAQTPESTSGEQTGLTEPGRGARASLLERIRRIIGR